jgi:putative zinc finger protein
MNDQNHELREALDDLAAELRSGHVHPEPDELAAYHAGELAPPEERRIQDHLASCRECASLLLDLEGLGDPSFGVGSGLAGKEEVWRRLRAEVESSKEGGAAPAAVVPFRRRTLSTSPRWLQALAAALLLATLGLSQWVVSLRQAVQEQRRPQIAKTLPLSSHAVRGEERDRAMRTIHAGDSVLLSSILIPLWSRSTRYRVVIARSDGSEVWSVAGLAPDRRGWLAPVVLPPHALSPGDYRIRVLGEGGEPIEEQPLRVESP